MSHCFYLFVYTKTMKMHKRKQSQKKCWCIHHHKANTMAIVTWLWHLFKWIPTFLPSARFIACLWLSTRWSFYSCSQSWLAHARTTCTRMLWWVQYLDSISQFVMRQPPRRWWRPWPHRRSIKILSSRSSYRCSWKFPWGVIFVNQR